MLRPTVLSVLGLLAMTGAARAETLEIIGDGFASHTAEFLKLEVGVRSECFASSLEAKKRADDLAARALTVLTPLADPKIPGGLELVPGANQQQEKTTYADGKSVVLCDMNHAWTSSSTIIIKLTHMEALAGLQDDLLSLAPQSPASDPSAINQAAVALSLGTPVAGIFSDTYDNLNDLALDNAYANALRQAQILLRRTPGAKLELLSVAPSQTSSGGVAYDRTPSSDDPSGNSLGRVSVELTRKFTFNVKEAALP
ncbi:MAG: hypothetical protein ACXWPM_08990 [Bdellovibrionota bacterium]